MLLAIGLFFFATQLQLMVCQSTVQNNMVAVRFTDVSPQSESKAWKKQIYKVFFIFYVLLDIFSYTFTRLQNTTDRLQVTKFKLQTFRCGYMYFEIKSRRSNFEIGGGGGRQ